MNLKGKLKWVAGIAAVALALAGPAVASASPTAGPTTCALQTWVTSNYVTAVGAGGRTTDVIHTDATRVGSWERFTLIDTGDGSHFGLRTSNGHFLTAVGGGGRTTDTIHSDAVSLQAWEKFSFVSLGDGFFGIKTIDGHFLTAVGGGGRTTDVIHTDATVLRDWEVFLLTCGV
jgi:hypothetical protein